jgi:hypothetical protein
LLNICLVCIWCHEIHFLRCFSIWWNRIEIIDLRLGLWSVTPLSTIFQLYRCYFSFCTFSFCHFVVCSFSIYGFWLPLWYLQTHLVIQFFCKKKYSCPWK